MTRRSKKAHAPRLLWVEGKDDKAVAENLCAAHTVPWFQVEAKNGVDEILDTFFTSLREPRAERFGVVVDANGNAQARWESIRGTLAAEGYREIPGRLRAEGMIVAGTPHRPVFGAWVMPDNGSPGALEDFAAQLVPESDALWKRASEAVDSIPREDRRFPAGRRSKAHIHTWLAWQEQPGSPMGQAIGKGDLRADAAGGPALRRLAAAADG